MIEELATIIAIERTSVTITSQIKSSCSSCTQVNTCGSGQVAKAIPQRKLTLNLPYPSGMNSDSFNVGDCVVLGIPEGDVLASAGQVYLLPLFGLITFSALGQGLITQHFINHELLALCFGLIGGYLGHRFAKYLQTQSRQASKLQPNILRALSTENKSNAAKIITIE